MFKYVVLDVICLVYNDSIWRFNNAYIEIGEFWTFLDVHRELIFDTSKEVLKDEGAGVCTQEVIYGAPKY